MFNWLSNYDYDFALAAIPVQIILLTFYSVRRNLPIRQSKSFVIVMFANLIMTITDIIACEINEIYNQFPVAVVYLVNMIYFLSFIIRGWALFDYTAESCREYKILDSRSRFLAALPFMLVSCFVLVTPWLGTIFTIGESGYQNCFLYQSIYICNYFYIFASFICVITCFNKLSLRVRTGLISFNIVLFLGLLLRKLFYGKFLVTSYISILAILIIYITAENPDLYRDPRIKLFNKDAFNVIGLDRLYRNNPFHCIIASVHNYETAKALYGAKMLNDTLKKVGDILVKNVPGYYVFYFGNGNFLLLKDGIIVENENEYAETWKDRFNKMKAVSDDEISLSLSIMVLPYNMMRDNIYQINDLIAFSFTKAYRENQKGNFIVNDDILNALSREKDVEAALGRALEQHKVDAYFQAIYSTKENRIVGAEALARLIDPEIGYIPPLEFIEVAEKNGDIMELGRQIFEKVCSFVEKEHLKDRGIDFINVNLSPAQCLNSLLAAELTKIAEDHNISMNMIDFEITESAVDDFRSIQKQIFLLQQKGAELSLDDFGTGTSNLTRLMHLPIHVVKIDMDVAQAYFNNEAQFLPDLIRMFQHANMKIVVEGVETEEMKNVLTELGCDYLQGFYFSKPLPADQFMDYLNSKTTK